MVSCPNCNTEMDHGVRKDELFVGMIDENNETIELWWCPKCHYTTHDLDPCPSCADLSVKLDEAKKEIEWLHDRGIVCAFCGKAWRYEGEKPAEELLKEVVDHEQSCEKNPYLARIKELREALKPFSRDGLCRELTGNFEGDASPVFQRCDALLTLGDFRRAKKVLGDGR